jgi:ParB family chromosome partitioning protein
MSARRLTLRIDDPLAPRPPIDRSIDADASHPPGEEPRFIPAFGPLRASGRLRTVAIDAVHPNARQPRRRFDDAALEQLTVSIRERGILQPPVVRLRPDGRFELIAGERRWRAAQRAGLSSIEVLVKDSDDPGALQDALMENVVRDDLTPVEEARAYATLIDDLAITREELGRRLGRSRASIANHLRILELPDEVLELLEARELTFAHGRALLLCDDHATRRTLARRAAAEGWSKRQLEDAARAAGAPRARTRPGTDPVPADQQALADELEERIARGAGLAVRIRATGRDGYVFTVHGTDAARHLAAVLAGGGR